MPRFGNRAGQKRKRILERPHDTHHLEVIAFQTFMYELPRQCQAMTVGLGKPAPVTCGGLMICCHT